MGAASTLGPAQLAAASTSIAAVMADHAPALDRLERGPVDDPATGDGSEPVLPGTDLLTAAPGPGADLAGVLTDGARAAGRAVSSGLPGVTSAWADAARAAATTPAGRGLATVLAGLAESCRNADRVDAERVALGLELAAERLAPADDGAHAGCLPAVVAAAADGALGALDQGAGLLDVVVAAADDGLVELEAGPVSNPRLVERGVVDPAAAGFLLVLDVLASVLSGEPLPAPPLDPVATPTPVADGSSPRYRVSCRIEPAEGCGIEEASWLESQWHELGEVERFEPTAARWTAGVLTTDPGRAIEALCEVGRPRELRVESVPSGG